jgi:hypothetical protein
MYLKTFNNLIWLKLYIYKLVKHNHISTHSNAMETNKKNKLIQ